MTTRTIVDLPATTHDFLFRDLSFNDLFSYSKVSKAAHIAVQEFYRRALRIENILLPYFSLEDIRCFRIIQYVYGVLISGSTALSFFERQVYPRSDLDLYVNVKYCTILMDFLVSAGYHFHPYISEFKQQPFNLQRAIEEAIERFEAPDPVFGVQQNAVPRYSIAGMVDVFTFTRDDGRKVEVIVCESNPIKVILGYHSTVVMNVISYTHAISLYPRSTFRERISLRNGRLREREAKAHRARMKYQGRGWHMINTVDPMTALDYNTDLHMFTRYIGDEQCWTVELPPVEDLVEAEPGLGRKEFLMAQSWKLEYINQRDARTSMRVLSSPRLKQAYCLAPELWDELLDSPMFGAVDEDADEDDEGEQSSLDNELHDIVSSIMAEPREEYIRDILLDEVAQIVAHYPEWAIPSSHAVQLLYDCLEDVFDTLVRKPRLELNFWQSTAGFIWLNVTIVLPQSRRTGRSRNGGNTATIRVKDDVRQTLYNYQIRLDVVTEL
ncbi:hypothetical protein VNI00_012206 [Paramarasmius palmivorus]|uniref:F-box domain-containing protein n=1 Tax=Paramarasmius palmivorus TaxID=297713 RepID=A0AAW0C8A4_9AGAR